MSMFLTRVVGIRWVVCKPILVLHFDFEQAEQYHWLCKKKWTQTLLGAFSIGVLGSESSEICYGFLTNKNIMITMKSFFDVLGEMFEGDSAETWVEKIPKVLMVGPAEGLVCSDQGGRTPIGASKILSERSACASGATIGPSGAVQTLSDSRSPLFLILIFYFFLPWYLNPQKGIS